MKTNIIRIIRRSALAFAATVFVEVEQPTPPTRQVQIVTIGKQLMKEP